MGLQSYREQHGYVLVVVLLFLMVFSMDVLYELSVAKNQLRMVAAWRLTESKNRDKEAILQYVEASLLQNISSECIVERMSPCALLQKPALWWKHMGCIAQVNNNQFLYVIEDLTEDNNAHYLRITVMNDFSSQRSALQSTLVTPYPVPSANLPWVAIGRQMLRTIGC